MRDADVTTAPFLTISSSHKVAEGLTLLREAQRKIDERQVGDPEAIYKIAQAYLVLGDNVSAFHVLRQSVEGGFSRTLT